MAIYEYKCGVCSRVQVVKRAITDKLEREPYCDYCVIPMERLYDATPAIFRGAGWGKS